MFMHGGLVHFAVNMLSWYQIGMAMEEAYGTWRIVIIYFTSGVAGFAFGAQLEMLIPSVGASGSIFGVMAVVLIDLLLNFKLVTNRWTELRNLLIQIIFSLALGLFPLIDNFAHVGGFVTGVITGVLLLPSLTFSTWDARGKLALRVLALPVLIAFLFWIMYTTFSTGATASQCTWCKYLDCIPINGWCDGYSS